jgi:hypothetical protein
MYSMSVKALGEQEFAGNVLRGETRARRLLQPDSPDFRRRLGGECVGDRTQHRRCSGHCGVVQKSAAIDHAFNSFFSSLRNLGSVARATIFAGSDLMNPFSFSRSA